MVNRRKKSLALDLKLPGDHDIFMKLLDDYDIIVEGFRPGVMESLNLDYKVVSTHFPKVIYVSITGYGQKGGFAHRAGHDLNYQALAGSFDTGEGLGKSLSVPAVPIADLAGGALVALSGLLAAIIERSRTGKGQHVDVSMFDGTFALNVFTLCHIQGMAKQKASSGHFLSGCQPFYNIYETSDGRQMAFCAVEPKFWRNFCLIVDRKDLLDKQFQGDKVTREIADIFKSRTQAQWVELLNEVDTCCEPVLTVNEAIDSSLGRNRNLTQLDAEGTLKLNNPIKSTIEPVRSSQPAPKLGQHTRQVLKQLGIEKS